MQRTGEALKEPHARRLHDQIRSASAVNVDETGWRLRGGTRTLWGALTPTAAVLRIAPDRHRREPEALLGEEFADIACSDRWWAYDYLDPPRRQLCWSHLIRDFTANSEGLATQKASGEAGPAIAASLFEAWQQFRGDGERARLIERIAPLRRRCSSKPPARAQRRSTTAASPPTCASAGRRYRPPPTIERPLSASLTCRLQRRSLFAYLTDVLNAKTRGDPIPLLA